MKILKNIMLISGVMVLLGSGAVQAQTCTASPDCTSLGYNKILSDCPNNAVKCPWDNSKVFCNKGSDGPKCHLGWIYYSDGTCSFDKVSGKVALGVVIYVKPNGIGGQAVTASDIGSYIWGGEGSDVPTLPNLEGVNMIKDFDSCGNTDKLLADSQTHPAAVAARNYVPSDAPETRGKWCLPAAGVLDSWNGSRFMIDEGIKKLGGRPRYPFPTSGSDRLWSSSEEHLYYAWTIWFHHSIYSRYKSEANFVHAVIEF